MKNEYIEILHRFSKEGELYKKLNNGRVECFACANRCRVDHGKTGICGVRYNDSGKLMVPYGYVSALNNDPIEKKPFFHLVPGMNVMSFGMLGCNFKCEFCQNWDISQFNKDKLISYTRKVTAKDVCDFASTSGSLAICSTYNEPLISSEWAVDIFKCAKKKGFTSCSYVSNGHATPEVIEYLKPFVDSYKVDLKCFNKDTYKRLGGDLSAVTDSIKLLHEKGFWVEVVTLIVPKMNDSKKELKDISGFISSVSNDIPWHVTAFHPGYKVMDISHTKKETLLNAYNIGKESGLNFIYTGNLPGSLKNTENTFCPSCGELLVERFGFRVLANYIKDGKCINCFVTVAGVWE